MVYDIRQIFLIVLLFCLFSSCVLYLLKHDIIVSSRKLIKLTYNSVELPLIDDYVSDYIIPTNSSINRCYLHDMKYSFVDSNCCEINETRDDVGEWHCFIQYNNTHNEVQFDMLMAIQQFELSHEIYCLYENNDCSLLDYSSQHLSTLLNNSIIHIAGDSTMREHVLRPLLNSFGIDTILTTDWPSLNPIKSYQISNQKYLKYMMVMDPHADSTFDLSKYQLNIPFRPTIEYHWVTNFDGQRSRYEYPDPTLDVAKFINSVKQSSNQSHIIVMNIGRWPNAFCENGYEENRYCQLQTYEIGMRTLMYQFIQSFENQALLPLILFFSTPDHRGMIETPSLLDSFNTIALDVINEWRQTYPIWKRQIYFIPTNSMFRSSENQVPDTSHGSHGVVGLQYLRLLHHQLTYIKYQKTQILDFTRQIEQIKTVE